MSAFFQSIFFVRPFKVSFLNLLFLTFLSGCGGGGSTTEKANSDTVAPLVTLNGASNLSLLQWDDYIEQGAIASDDQDAVVTVEISGSVDATVAGVYTLSYTAIDSANNTTTITRRIEVLPQRPFITTWKTDNDGSTNNNQIRIGTQGTGYDYRIDWGDGTVEENIQGNTVHTYASPGTYTVSINGRFPQIYFDGFGYDNQKLLSIDQWGDIKWKSMHKAFFGCINVAGNATDTPNLLDVTDMSEMFRNAKVYNQDISSWDVSSVTNMSKMFNTALMFNQDISNWDVSKVTDMSWAFAIADSFNQPLNDWDVSSVTNMSNMFRAARNFNQPLNDWNVSSVKDMSLLFFEAYSFNQDIASWDVSAVTNMRSMFAGAGLFNQDIGNWNVSSVANMGYLFFGATFFNQNLSKWDTSSVTDISYIFYEADGFNQNIGTWDVSKVTNMSWAFGGADSFNQPLNDWDVSSVTNMSNMFRAARSFNQPLNDWNVSSVKDMSLLFFEADSFNQDIASWDVSAVTNMQSMFAGAGLFNQDIGNWNVSSVSNMRSMFYFAESFDQNLSSWNVSSVTDMTSMFFNVKLSTTNYDALLLGWSVQSLKENVSFHGGNSLYSSSAQSARDTLTDFYNWTMVDAGLDI